MDIFEFRERAGSGVDDATETLAQQVIGAAIEVHRHLRAGLPEIAYRNALAHELGLRGVPYAMEVTAQVVYKGKIVASGKVDLVVAGVLVLELKVVESIHDLHVAQTLGYLKILSLQLGLILNFNVSQMRNGVRRVINSDCAGH